MLSVTSQRKPSSCKMSDVAVSGFVAMQFSHRSWYTRVTESPNFLALQCILLRSFLVSLVSVVLAEVHSSVTLKALSVQMLF